jgi:hypothetical protein
MELNEISSIKKYVKTYQTINMNDKTHILNLNDLLSIKHYVKASQTINMNDKTRILNSINIFFLGNCEHNNSPDNKYCSKCEITFDR